MKIPDRLLDLFYKRQKVLLPLAMFLVLCAISFKFDHSSFEWHWNDYPIVAVLIVAFGILQVAIFIQLEQKKMRKLIEEIKQEETLSIPEASLDSLTGRQRQVFDLIGLTRTNKQITQELFIELSTLKTHINQIYKKLNISSRKEARRFGRKSSRQ